MESTETLLFKELRMRDIRVFVLHDPTSADDEQPVGVAAIRHMPGAVSAVLEGLFIQPSHRHHGAGRRLLNSLADRCRAEGVRHLEAPLLEPTMAVFLAGCGFRNTTKVLVFDL